MEKHEKETKCKRAVHNWRSLIRGLKLRRDIQRKYGVLQGDGSERKKSSEPELIEIDSE